MALDRGGSTAQCILCGCLGEREKDAILGTCPKIPCNYDNSVECCPQRWSGQ